MRTKDLSREEIDAIDATAVLVYQSKPGGVYAVRELANLLQWEEYGPCEPCEDDEVPMLDGSCMICGTKAITSIEEVTS